MPWVARAVTGTDMPSGSVMPTTSAASMTAVAPCGVPTMPYAAARDFPPAPVTSCRRRSPPRDNTASSVPSPPSAIGHGRISASGHTRASPRAIAAQIARASSEPLKESGAMTTTGGRAAGMAYDFSVMRGIAILTAVAAWPETAVAGTALPLALVLVAWDARRMAADYAREERWAQEIVPALVVGDAVYLDTADAREGAGDPHRAVRPAPRAASSSSTDSVSTPTGGSIGGVRVGLADAGYVTLAVQMPVLAASRRATTTATRCPRRATGRRGDPPTSGRRASRRSRSSRTASAQRW